MEFNVKLDRYEGPYTKLIDLITERKLSITEISLVSVADEYLKHVQTLSEKNLVDISQFIVVASTLMLMKVKSLLPGVTYTEEEEKQVHDLEYKLELYQLLTSACIQIRKTYGKNTLYIRKRSALPDRTIFLPDKRVTGSFLQSIAKLTLQSFKVPQALISIAVAQTLRIEDVITRLIDRIKTVQSVTLESLATSASTLEEKKKLLIIHFIALLELLKTGTVQVHQELEGGEIHISSGAIS